MTALPVEPVAEEKVLLLDDDVELVGALPDRVEGYVLERASTPGLALALARRNQQIRLVISDLRLRTGDPDGVTFLEEVRELLPASKFVVLSGYQMNASENRRLQSIGGTYYKKGRMNLGRIVRDSLASTQPSAEHAVRAARLEEMHRLWIEDFLAEVRPIPNPSGTLVYVGDDALTVEQLVREIQDLTPRAFEILKDWIESKAVLRSLRSRSQPRS